MRNWLDGHPEIKSWPDFDRHEAVYLLSDPELGDFGWIAIHRRNPASPSFGATRLWSYASLEEALKDALRLSKMMSYKAALAGLPCGGGKGVIVWPAGAASPELKTKLLLAYARAVNELDGGFITGADVGLTTTDLLRMKNSTPHLVGFKGDPTYFTGVGLGAALAVALQYQFGSPELAERTFAIQGLGKVGLSLLERLSGRAKKIAAADVSPTAVAAARSRFPEVAFLPPEEIFDAAADVFCPCALSHALNPGTISRLRSRLVLGGANNQLVSNEIGDQLGGRGILYAPDYVVNAGGLICVVDEFLEPVYNEKRIEQKVTGITGTLKNIFSASQEERRPPHRVADTRAERIFNSYQS